MLVQAFISCLLDYCNSLLYGISDGLLQRISRSPGHMAPVVVTTSHQCCGNCTGCQFVSELRAFKVAGLVHQSLAGAAPAYLAADCHLLSDAGRRPLRSYSNDIRKLLVPQTHNKFGDRSFSAAGPRLWNDLSPGLRGQGLSFDSFRRCLKTHLFGS